MDKKRSESPIYLPDGMRIRSEDVGHSQESLLGCPKCSRSNGPKAKSCIYCGASLSNSDPITDIEASADPEPEFQAFVVAVGPSEKHYSMEQIARLASALDLSSIGVLAREDISTAIPFERHSTYEDATRRAEILSENGFRTMMLSEAALDLDRPPRRIRRLEFDGDELIFEDFNSGRVNVFKSDHLKLAVLGSIISTQVEETAKKGSKDSEPADIVRMDKDVPVLDIYAGDDELGFRVSTTGFDFSCLGDQMELTAASNLARLSEAISNRSKIIRIDAEYKRLRKMLDRVWPFEEKRTVSAGDRSRHERKMRSTRVTSTNERQFTRYSRLQRFFI